METSKERVLKAINHEQPGTVPVSIGNIYGVERFFELLGVDSKAGVFSRLDLDVEASRPVYLKKLPEGLGIFGTPLEDVFGADGSGYASSRGTYPLMSAESTSDIDRYPWPSAADFDYASPSRVLARRADKARRIDTKYGILEPGKTIEECTESGPWIPLICTLFDLFGMEETLVNFHLKAKIMEAAVQKIEDFLLDFTSRMCLSAHGSAEMAYFGDDFSTQRGMLLSPEHWRRFLLPTYKRLFAAAKSKGMKVWFHSCGTFRAVLGDLIDAGMDVWETVQTHLPGNEPEVLKREYGRHLTFFGAISTQATLPHGTEKDVRSEVRARIEVLGKGGGYICGSDHGIMPDVPAANVLALIDEARRFTFGGGKQ
jgi:uroporphyrinogen decarboxylase